MSKVLRALDSAGLANLVETSHVKDVGFGGRTAQIKVGAERVFCKLIPLTRLETLLGNHRSTRNLFRLPTYYQYGIGSVGFGAWRELAAQDLASKWVLYGKHGQFPIMHHWRVVEFPGSALVDPEADEYLSHAAARGQDETTIRERLLALRKSTSQIAIFTEHFPKTLSEWMLEKIQSDRASAHTEVSIVVDQSRQAFEFMRNSNFVHFDAHLDNILTDGTQLYFADFGLAVHKSFDLSEDERKFMNDHAYYDPARFASSLVHMLCRAIPGVEGWRQKLEEPVRHTNSLPPAAIAALQSYAPMAKYMADFAKTLINTNRQVAFAPPSSATS